MWLILLSQLTSYSYALVIIAAPLTRVRRDLEVWLFGFAALTQFIWLSFGFYDDRHAILTLLTLVFANFLILSFAPKRWFQRQARAAAPPFAKTKAEQGAEEEPEPE